MESEIAGRHSQTGARFSRNADERTAQGARSGSPTGREARIDGRIQTHLGALPVTASQRLLLYEFMGRGTGDDTRSTRAHSRGGEPRRTLPVQLRTDWDRPMTRSLSVGRGKGTVLATCCGTTSGWTVLTRFVDRRL